MKRPSRGDMPIPLTLPLHLDLRLRARERRRRRLALWGFALAAALLAAAFFLPAKADRVELSLGTLEIGDDMTVERADGIVVTYEVVALDVVYGERLEFALDGDDASVALVTPWPFDAAGEHAGWRYVLTGRKRF